jgi:hypothetical protein
VVAQDEFLLLAGALFGGLDVEDVLVLFHAGTLLFVVGMAAAAFLVELLGNEEVIEEEQDYRQRGNLEP